MKLFDGDAAFTTSTMRINAYRAGFESSYESIDYGFVDLPALHVLVETNELIRRVYAKLSMSDDDKAHMFAGADEAVMMHDAVQYETPTRVSIAYSPAPQRTTYVHTFAHRRVMR